MKPLMCLMRRLTTGLTLIAILLLCVCFVAIAGGQAEARRRSDVINWEYGYITVYETYATLEAADSLERVQMPIVTIADPGFIGNDYAATRKHYNPFLRTLNHYGRAGWEVAVNTNFEKGVPVLVRRQR